jgi:hypothetical protein
MRQIPSTEFGKKNNDVNPNLNLRNSENFQIPAPRIEWFKRIPLYFLPKEWNNCGHLMYYTNRFYFPNGSKKFPILRTNK